MTISLVASAYNGHSSSKRNEKRWHGAIPMFIGAIGLGVGVFMHNPVIAFFFVILAKSGPTHPWRSGGPIPQRSFRGLRQRALLADQLLRQPGRDS